MNVVELVVQSEQRKTIRIFVLVLVCGSVIVFYGGPKVKNKEGDWRPVKDWES